MTNILIFHENNHMRYSFEHQISTLLAGKTINNISNINSLLDAIAENTELILLNYSWKDIQEKLILEIKSINSKIAIILSTCFSEYEIPPYIKNQVAAILYCPCDLSYIDTIKDHLD